MKKLLLLIAAILLGVIWYLSIKDTKKNILIPVSDKPVVEKSYTNYPGKG